MRCTISVPHFIGEVCWFFFAFISPLSKDFPGGSDDKESACNVGDLGSIPGLGRPLEEDMETHASILAWRILMDRGAWRAAVRGVAQSAMTEVT